MSATNPEVDAFMDQATRWRKEMSALRDILLDCDLTEGENTQAALRIEFTAPQQVAERSSTVKSYIQEAVEIEEAGLEVPKKKVEDFEVPIELETRFREDETYREAFEALTPGRKKSYLLHFSSAKRADTRKRRIEKCRAKVLQGKGFHER